MIIGFVGIALLHFDFEMVKPLKYVQNVVMKLIGSE